MRWIFTKQNNRNNYSSKYGISSKCFESTESKMNSSPSMLHLLKSFIPNTFLTLPGPYHATDPIDSWKAWSFVAKASERFRCSFHNLSWSASFWRPTCVYKNSKIYTLYIHLQMYIIRTCFNDFCTSICDLPSLITVCFQLLTASATSMSCPPNCCDTVSKPELSNKKRDNSCMNCLSWPEIW